MSLLHHGVQILVLLALGPLMLGVINKTKAAFAGRAGPPLLQVYFDLVKLMKKDSVTSRTATWVFIAAPAVSLVAITFAALLTPIGPAPAVIHFSGDFVLFVYLFGLARFFTTSAALDTGSPFEGMGAARDVTYAVFAEVTLLFALLAMGSLSHATSLSEMLGGLAAAREGATAPIVLVAVALSIVVLAENSRIPVDDPNTHLELTMIHEVMVLDHSGPMLGVILYGASIKLVVFSSLVVRVVLPPGADAGLGWVAFVALLLAVALAIGVIESVTARLRLTRVPAMLVTACLLAGFGLLLVVT